MFLGQSRGTRTIHMVITIYFPDGTYKCECWNGPTVTSIKKGVRQRYPKMKMDYGTPFVTLSWGGH